MGEPLNEEPSLLPVGKARMVLEGEDLVIIAVGSMVGAAVEAALTLASQGISAAVMDVRFVKPFDRDLILEKAAATGTVLTVEEGVMAGGFGGCVLELFSDEGLQVQTARLGIPDAFVEHGSRSELLADLGLTAEGIAAKARLMLEERRAPRVRRVSYIRSVPN
jgi:1-deoxy-D-xylulose-5-phosphate synthase